MSLNRTRVLPALAFVVLASGHVRLPADDPVRSAAGYPNLIVNRAQIQAIRQKITRQPYRALWERIVADAEQLGRRHVNQTIRQAHRWERAIEFAVTGDREKIADLRGHFLYCAGRPVPPVTHYNWHLAADAVIYDLIGASFSVAEQQQIREYFVEQARAVMLFLKSYRGTANMMSLQRYNVALIGYVARSQEIIEWALNTEWGFKDVINRLEDGIWDEANAYAIHYVLPGWIAVAEAAQNYDGTDLWAYQSPDGDDLQTFLDRYLDMAWPVERTGVGRGSIRIASYGDGSTAMPMLGSPDDIYLINVPAFDPRSAAGRVSLGAALEVAYARRGDPKYAWLLSLTRKRHQSHERAYLNYTALTHGVDLPADIKPPIAASNVWPKAGRAILRADESPAYWTSGSPAAFLVMNKWYGHDHRDRLSLMFHANGRLLYPDMNVIQYEPQHIGWTRHGIGHNLVLVDRIGPWGGPQEIRHMFTPELKFVAVTADPSAQVNRFMKKLEVWETRALLLTREYLLDLFWLSSQTEKNREYTWVLHGLGQLNSDDIGYFRRPEMPRLNHFKWIKDEQHWPTDTNWSVAWRQQTGGLLPGTTTRTGAWFDAPPVGVRMTMLGAPETEAHIGHGPLGYSIRYGINPHHSEGSIPLALARRNAHATIFTSLHEPFVEQKFARLQPVKLRRVMERQDDIAVAIIGGNFRDFVLSDLGGEAESRALKVIDRADCQQQFEYSGFAWLRVAGDTVTARGNLQSFRLYAPKVTRCLFNGKPVAVERDNHGYIAFQALPASQPRPAELTIPEWNRPPPQPAVVTPLGPIVATVALRAGRVKSQRLKITNLTDSSAPGRIHVSAPRGLVVGLATNVAGAPVSGRIGSPDGGFQQMSLGQLAPYKEYEFSLRLKATPELLGKLLPLEITPEVAGRRGRPLSIPVAVGVCLEDDRQERMYTAITPHYRAMIPKQWGTIINLEDAAGLRRSAGNETGLNHWGFPAAGLPARGERRIFGLNGNVAGSGQEVKLVARTSDTLTFQRSTPSAYSNGPAETLRYRFGLEHIAMSITAQSEQTDKGMPMEITLGAFERHLTARTVLHWSDGDSTDFSPAAIGLTYHQYPAHGKPWKRIQWVAIEQAAPFAAVVILLEFPPEAEVQAGTHSQLYFKLRVKSGEWVIAYFLTPEQFAARQGSQ